MPHKVGRFADASSPQSVHIPDDIKVGARCEIESGDAGLRKRGIVRYVGETKFSPGACVGVEYDEPFGKNDGNGAPPQPGPDDVSTAILRPKKSPNRLIVDEATIIDDNSVATTNPVTMDTLNLFRGDTIIVRGKKRRDTVLICLSSDDVEEGRIQVNKVARNNLRIKLGDLVNVHQYHKIQYNSNDAIAKWLRRQI